MVLMTPVGAGIRGSIYHSHSFDAQATRIPGWKIVMPSTPRDAYGLMLSAIAGSEPGHVPHAEGAPSHEGRPGEEIPGEPDDEQGARADDRRAARRSLARGSRSWPELEELYIPIGEARDRARGHARHRAHLRPQRADVRSPPPRSSRREGIDAEVIDLRSLHPYDWDAIEASVRKTNRVLCVNEDTEITNFGEHLIRRIVEELFYELHARRACSPARTSRASASAHLEKASVPQPQDVENAMRALATEPA